MSLSLSFLASDHFRVTGSHSLLPCAARDVSGNGGALPGLAFLICEPSIINVICLSNQINVDFNTTASQPCFREK
jgi:hypothetical protein